MFDPHLFDRGSDVRGEYPRQINEELAWFVGRYLATYLARAGHARPRVVVGRDGRLSSPAIYGGLVQGIAAGGGEPIPGGLATTDMVFWAAGHGLEGAVAGAMVTASHNPPQYNGIKMVLRGEKGVETIRPVEHLKAIFEADRDGDGPVAAEAAPSARFPASSRLRLPDRFTAWACDRAPDRAAFDQTVLFDAGNGVGSLFVDPLKRLVPGARIESLFGQIDGTFPNRPSNPGLPGAVDVLKRRVTEQGAAFGAALDGDADRVFVVDEKGGFVSGDQLLAAIANGVMAKSDAAKKPVVFAATCSWLMVETIRRQAGEPVICRVGQETVKAAMQEVQAVFGGESSAHYNFSDSYYQDSGIIAMMTLWQALHEAGKTVSQFVGELDPWPHSGEINMRIHSDDWSKISAGTIERFREENEAKSDGCYVLPLDGINVYHPFDPAVPDVGALFPEHAGDAGGMRYRSVHPDYRPDWWFSLRRSNNEPLLRLNVECRSPGDLETRTRDLIEQVMSTCSSIGDCRTEVVDWGNLAPA